MKQVHIFLIGTGVIGSALLEQLSQSKQPITVIGIANSDHAIMNKTGVSLGTWKKDLENGEKNVLDTVVAFLERADVTNKILVDCTASEKVAAVYKQLLSHGISVVCANKIANTGSLSQYNELRVAAKKGNAQFLYETNVGAGLPLLSTLQDLVATGDEIIKIEGIMSGTLSYIFNTFVGGTPFSEVVKKAKELGYTEPDPRIDLSGADVGRKLLILAREIGMQLEPETVMVESLVPKPLQGDMSIDSFFEKLPSFDNIFAKIQQQAQASGEKLAYMGVITTVGHTYPVARLIKIGREHPFYSLSGSDNIFAITTKRYNKTPLVIRGPGAGAGVTAAGVFADILKVTRTIL